MMPFFFVVLSGLANVITSSVANESFCDRVHDNHGCCLECGYAWVNGRCETKELPPATEYCESLLQPAYRGCCQYCGYAWETGADKCIASGGPTRSDILLATFDGAANSTRSWVTVNDPVMGGASVSSFDTVPPIGRWWGEVKRVPSIGAPGFCTLRTSDHALFPNASGTKFLGLHLTGGSGLPAADFTLQVAAKRTPTGQVYQAQLTNQYCCADDCRVPWDAFALSFRGQPVKGPPLSEHLADVTQLGLGTAGTAGAFALNISSFYATLNATRPCSSVLTVTNHAS